MSHPGSPSPLRPALLGDASHDSLLPFFVMNDLLVPSNTQWPQGMPPGDMVLCEKAGPRCKLGTKGLLAALERRLQRKAHAVLVVVRRRGPGPDGCWQPSAMPPAI
jgi:hypothetical protein